MAASATHTDLRVSYVTAAFATRGLTRRAPSCCLAPSAGIRVPKAPCWPSGTTSNRRSRVRFQHSTPPSSRSPSKACQARVPSLAGSTSHEFEGTSSSAVAGWPPKACPAVAAVRELCRSGRHTGNCWHDRVIVSTMSSAPCKANHVLCPCHIRSNCTVCGGVHATAQPSACI